MMSLKYPFSEHSHYIAINCVGGGVQGAKALYSDLRLHQCQMSAEALTQHVATMIAMKNNIILL